MSVLILIGLMGGVCAAPEDTTKLSYTPPPLNHVQYRFEWSPGQATPHEEGGWVIVNNLGYRIHVKSGFITNYTLQLVPCQETTPETDESATTWQDWIAISTAHAGHSSIAPDPSLLSTQHVESLTTLQDITTESLVVTDHRYCQVHYVLGPADVDAVGIGDHHAMNGTTLLVEGSYQGPGDSVPTPFRIETDLGIGTFVDWPPNAPAEVDMNHQGALVVVHRTLSDLWNHVDFVTQEDTEIAWFVLQNIVDSAQAHVHTEHAED